MFSGPTPKSFRRVRESPHFLSISMPSALVTWIKFLSGAKGNRDNCAVGSSEIKEVWESLNLPD